MDFESIVNNLNRMLTLSDLSCDLNIYWELRVNYIRSLTSEFSFWQMGFFVQVHITKEFLQLEPIGLVFVFFFALIIVIQFTAMLFHRFGTLSHILAATELNFCCNKKSEELSQDALIDKVCSSLISPPFNSIGIIFSFR